MTTAGSWSDEKPIVSARDVHKSFGDTEVLKGISLDVMKGETICIRQLAARAKDAHQSRRLLALAAVRDGMSRGEAAKIGGMDRQTLRDWVHRFNREGPEGLVNRPPAGRRGWLSSDQLLQLADIVETGRTRKATASCAGGASI